MKKLLFCLTVILTFGKWTVLGIDLNYDMNNMNFENELCNVIEENKYSENAKEVNTGELIKSSFEDDKCKNYYEFTIKRDAKVNIKFIGESFELQCTILDSCGTALYNQGWKSIQDCQSTDENALLKAGTYYLEIDSEYKGTYTFTINEGYGIIDSKIDLENINDKYNYIDTTNQVHFQENGEYKLKLSFLDVLYNNISIRNEDISIEASGFEENEIEIDNENLIIKTNKVWRENKKSEGKLIISVNNYTKIINVVIQKGSFGIAKIKKENGDLYNGILMINKYIKPKRKEIIEELEVYTINDGELVLPISQTENEVEFYGIIAVPISEEDITNSQFYEVSFSISSSELKEGAWDLGEIVLQKPKIIAYTYLEDGKTLAADANINVGSYSCRYGNINFDLNSNAAGKFNIASLGKKFYRDNSWKDLPQKVILKSYCKDNNSSKVSNEQVAFFDTDKEIKLKYKKDQVILNILNSYGYCIENGKEFICEIEDLIDKTTSEIYVKSENSVLKLSGFEKGHEYKVNIRSLNIDGKEVEESATFNFIYNSEIIRDNIKLSYPIIRGKVTCDYRYCSVSTEVNILNSKRECIYETKSDINGYFNIYDLDLQGEYYIKVFPSKDNPEYSGTIVKKKINLDRDKNYVEVKIEKASRYDLNRDGEINREDETCFFNEYFNSKRYESNFDVKYDYNLDGVIDIYDLVKLCKNIKE